MAPILRQKLKQTFQGLRSLKELPSVIFIIDLENDFEVVSEAKKLNIPIVAIIDNNSNNIVYSKYSNNSANEFPILNESDNKKYDKYLKDLSDLFKGN